MRPEMSDSAKLSKPSHPDNIPPLGPSFRLTAAFRSHTASGNSQELRKSTHNPYRMRVNTGVSRAQSLRSPTHTPWPPGEGTETEGLWTSLLLHWATPLLSVS